MIKKLIGLTMMASPFAGIACFSYVEHGLYNTLSYLGIATAIWFVLDVGIAFYKSNNK